MKRLLIATSLAFASTLAVAAPPSEQSIEELLTLSHSEQLLQTALGQVEQSMQAAFEAGIDAQNLSAEEKQQAIEFFGTLQPKLQAIIAEFLTWDQMKRDYIKLFHDTFTQEEIDGLIAFYKTPAGKALVDKMPLVVQNISTILQARLAPMAGRIATVVSEASAEFNARESHVVE
ncbi:DUF2059 domain-containing protein [Chitiniphilus shinanonensis]|uniref:DUF2059 domain-containing protein n=1 Tax=Chitiniphilus shinanonensis TaxID=553088 RepID=UPI0030325995